ncbi:MAG: ribonuclease Z [Parachlamydiales bacterium]|jgi:ribonuclease Z
MSNKDITFLGTSSQQPTRKRSHGAILVRWNEEGLLFDPGEGTQRQFIFANIAPPAVSRIFVSHFHGDHCLGLGSMLMRLNLDKVKHPIHCYYPANFKKNFQALRYGCVYHETISVVEHLVKKSGLVEDDGAFQIEAAFLKHGIDTLGWRITEPDRIKFHKELLKKHGIEGQQVKKLEKEGAIKIDGKLIKLEEVSFVKKGAVLVVLQDTRYFEELVQFSRGASVLICEATFLEAEKQLARKYLHMTAKEAAELAKKSGAGLLLLTHFSARYPDSRAFSKEAAEVFPNTVAAEDFKRINFPV